MIYGIGIDTEIVGRVKRFLEEHPVRIGAVFTKNEQAAAELLSPEHKLRYYASAFSGKEAVMKALKTGWSPKVEWSEIEIPLGDSASAWLYGGSALMADQMGISRIVVSFTGTSQIVVATAVAEKD